MGSTENTQKRPRIGEDSFFQKASRSLRNLGQGWFGDVPDAVMLRASEHGHLHAVNMNLRTIPRHLDMEAVTSDPKRNAAFIRVFEKLETALARGNIDLTAESVTCTTSEKDVVAGASYTIQCRYVRKKFNAGREKIMIDFETIWSVSQFDNDPDLKTVLLTLPTGTSADGALQIDFHLVFRAAAPVQ